VRSCFAAREFWSDGDWKLLFWSVRRVGAGAHLTDCVNVNSIAPAKLDISDGDVKENQTTQMKNGNCHQLSKVTTLKISPTHTFPRKRTASGTIIIVCSASSHGTARGQIAVVAFVITLDARYPPAEDPRVRHAVPQTHAT